MICKLDIAQAFPFLPTAKVVVGVSGGADSMALLHLLYQIGTEVVVAHCNFQLRAQESNQEELLVKKYAKEVLGVSYCVKHFDTKTYAQHHKLNTQLAARELRYAWFEQLCVEHQAQYIAVAHHADDNLETFFINLFRGTGLAGLMGIPIVNGKIIRPLLNYTRADIMQYIGCEKIPFLNDSSNETDHYLRNRIRHHLSPVLHTLAPQIIHSLGVTQQNLKSVQGFVQEQIQQIRQAFFVPLGENTHCQVCNIKTHPQRAFVALELFKPYGFTTALELEKLFDAQVGKYVLSQTHRLSVEPNGWLLSPLQRNTHDDIYFIEHQEDTAHLPIGLLFEPQSYFFQNSADVILIDANRLNFPLLLQKPRTGMEFYPKGMNGRKKKLSKFFRDEKYSSTEKTNQWLLTTLDNQII